jgi:uncharacterized protein (TIGR03435 family)
VGFMAHRFSGAGLALMTGVLLIRAGNAQPMARPSFEAASIKLSPNCRPSPNAGPLLGRLEFACITPRMLIQAAYGGFTGEKLNARYLDAIGGPGWLDTDWYQISAKAQGKPSVAQMMGPMLQVLLEERFQLKVHIDSKPSIVFALTVSKAGRLRQTKEGSCKAIDLANMPAPDPSAPPPRYCGEPSMYMSPRGLLVLDVPGVTMEEFAGRMLGTYLGRPLIDRPIVDKTGLTGRFDVKLEFARDRSTANQPSGLAGSGPEGIPDEKPSIFGALQQQLGLKLSSDKASIPTIVIDAVSRPTGN